MNGYTPTPQHIKTTTDMVSVRNPKGQATLGDLRALLAKAEEMPDSAVITVAGVQGSPLDTQKYVEDVAITHRRRVVAADSGKKGDDERS